MSWLIVRMAAAYALPVGTLVAAMAWGPGGGFATVTGMAAWTALAALCQVLLLRAHVRAERSARFDPLTGLPGRTLLLDRMRRALTGPTEVGLVFLDLDGFKEVNDTYGHGAGDQVLVEVAQRLRHLSGPEAVVARYGGDEFAVLVPAGQAETTALAHQIEASMRRPVVLSPAEEGPGVALSASVGLATTSVGGSVDDMLAVADEAMYAAKRAMTGIRTAVPNRETHGARP